MLVWFFRGFFRMSFKMDLGLNLVRLALPFREKFEKVLGRFFLRNGFSGEFRLYWVVGGNGSCLLIIFCFLYLGFGYFIIFRLSF